MRSVILGGDGYLGWPIAMRLSQMGPVTIVDNLGRRLRHRAARTRSLTPIATLDERTRAWSELTGCWIDAVEMDITEPRCLASLIGERRPDTVVHLAGQPSSRWAGAGVEQAVETVRVSAVGSMRLLWALRDVAPRAHLVRVGTMGEYGRPGIEIPEGELEVLHRGHRDRLPMPLQPMSLYDLAKAHESVSVQTCARLWGLAVTDIRQGAVYGAETSETRLDPRLVTRLDYDRTFGTALNRFCVQAACEQPLTVAGHASQPIPMLSIEDTVGAIELAVSFPPVGGFARVCNLFAELRTVGELAALVCDRALAAGLHTEVQVIGEPDALLPCEYGAVAAVLPGLGLRPRPLTDSAVSSLIEFSQRHRSRVLVNHLAADPGNVSSAVRAR
jgi:UDP-sulfoquinovose synthase